MERMIINSLAGIFERVLEAYEIDGTIADRLILEAQHEIMMARAE
jgi:hypothetical protein